MNIKEEKREKNNELIREYVSSSTEKRKYLYQLMSFNSDLVGYCIFKYFPGYKFRYDIYQIGIAALMIGIEHFEMCMECDLEDYLVSCIVNTISKYNLSEHITLVTTNKKTLNMGDIYYNEFHDITETLSTKTMRDGASIKEYKKNLKTGNN